MATVALSSDVVMTTSGACTARVVLPLTAETVAEMVVVPVEMPEASPVWSIVATAGIEEVHVAWPLRSRVLPSEYVPVAVNCCETPVEMLGLAGVTEIDTNAGTMVMLSALLVY